MRVLQVVEACGAGVGRHVRMLCEGLVGRGHRVTLAYSPRRLDEPFRRFVEEGRDGLRPVPLEVGRKVAPVSDLRGVLALARVLRSEGPFDVVHGHSSKGGALARVAGRLAGVPTVYTPHSLILSSPMVAGVEARFYAVAERALGRWATSRFIAVSEDERDFAVGLGLVPASRVAVVENGLEDEDFERPLPEVTEAGLDRLNDRAPLTFGAVMRFSEQKAPHLLVEAFAELGRLLPRMPTRLVVAGDGELFAEVERRVEAGGLGGRIILLGWRTDTSGLLREFDVFVSSSLYEGFSYGLLEAMAAGLPVVSTDVFGARRALSGVSGNVVVPTGNPTALAKGMGQVATLSDPGSLRRALRGVGRANRDYARIHFLQSESVRRTLKVYESLLQ